MKVLFTINVLLLSGLIASGQSRSDYDKLLTAGHSYFSEEQYHLAIGYYEKALAFNISNPLVDYNLAQAHRKTFHYTEAETYYFKVLHTAPDDHPLSLYYYALMLKLNGDLADAIKAFDEFIARYGHAIEYEEYSEQAIIEKAGCEIAEQERGLPSIVKPQLVTGDVNTAYNDFSPAFRSADHLVVTSSRIPANRKLIDYRNGEGFTDNYYLRRIGGQWHDYTRQQFSVTNSTYHDGSGSFTRAGDKYFFTVCEAVCRIYETRLEKGDWTKPKPLSAFINHPDAEAKHPAISPGGDTLYFASNRSGGFGQFDIWISVKSGDNQWSAPINLGGTINTKANDIAPSVTATSSILFFASDGHPGFGGVDLFAAKSMSNGDTILYNLNYPFNSAKDDCFLTFNGSDIYWSSNRDGGKGGFDIYMGRDMSSTALVSRLSRKNRNDSRTVTLTSRTARSENIQLLASANEETIDYHDLTYERKAIVNQMVENRLKDVANSLAAFPGITQEEFELLNEISRVRFQGMLLREKYASILLTEVVPGGIDGDPLSITGQLIDSLTGSALKNAKVLLANEYGEILKITRTNEAGFFRFTGVSVRSKLFLRLENSSLWNANATVSQVATHGSGRQNAHYVENVYFDFDHYVIRPEAAQVLVELADYLKSNPGSQVEIYAFADDRGSSAYNFELTQKRGDAVAAFLTRNGVDATSLAIIPKGRQKTRLATNELQRQFNRRAEFYINGVPHEITPSAKTYILKKEADWAQISRLTGVSREELKNLNGSQGDMVKAFQPVRVPLNATAISEDLFFVGI